MKPLSPSLLDIVCFCFFNLVTLPQASLFLILYRVTYFFYLNEYSFFSSVQLLICGKLFATP